MYCELARSRAIINEMLVREALLREEGHFFEGGGDGIRGDEGHWGWAPKKD